MSSTAPENIIDDILAAMEGSFVDLQGSFAEMQGSFRGCVRHNSPSRACLWCLVRSRRKSPNLWPSSARSG